MALTRSIGVVQTLMNHLLLYILLKFRVSLSYKGKKIGFYIFDRILFGENKLNSLWHSQISRIVDRNTDTDLFTANIARHRLKLINQWAWMLLREWPIWQKFYAPIPLEGKTVLDVGAGCGETALLFHLHGASKIIAIEPNSQAVECLVENAKVNDWNVETVPEYFSLEHLKYDFDFMKMDIEGGESVLLDAPDLDKPAIVEVHNRQVLKQFLARGYKLLHTSTDDKYLIGKHIERVP